MRFAKATKWIAPCSDSCECEYKADGRILKSTAHGGFSQEDRSEDVRKRMDIRLYGSTQIAYRVSHTAYIESYSFMDVIRYPSGDPLV